MPIAPFDEAPYDRYQQQPVSGGINTNSYDQFRQGVSIRTQRELYMGMCPKMLPERQFTPDSGNDSTVYGQPKAFKDVGNRQGTAQLVITTHVAREAAMQAALKGIKELSVLREVHNLLRVEPI